MKSIGSTNINKFYFNGHLILAKDKSNCCNKGRSKLLTVFPCSNIFLELRHAISSFTDIIEICCLELKGIEFCQLVRASIHAFELKFNNCKILTDSEFNLGQMEGCKIQALIIDYSYQVYDSRSDYEVSLMKIFVAIFHWSNLMRSLNRLFIRWNDKIKDLLLEKANEELNDMDYDRVELILKTSETRF